MESREDNKKFLVIDPPKELRFTGPFTRPVMTIMTLKNPTSHLVLFKIRTTTPRMYCVRPTLGTVPPMGATQVQVSVRPFDYNANQKTKHKFLVQTLVGPDDCEDLNKAWKEAEAESDTLADYVLKCVFEDSPNLLQRKGLRT